MLPRRLPVLLAFVGGCLSTAAMVGVWRADDDASASPRRAPVVDRIVERREPAVAPVVESVENDDIAGPPLAEPGRSVAEVLARLEAQYREELAAAEPVTPPAPVATAAAAAPPAEVPEVPEVPAPPETPVAEAAPVLANVQVANVQQDVYNGDVHQGDVNQAQQLALVQYVQMLMLPPNGRVVPSAPPSGTKTRRLPHKHIAITDPNNPWGFDFPPTPLVK